MADPGPVVSGASVVLVDVAPHLSGAHLSRLLALAPELSEIAGKLTIKMTNVPWTEILSVIMQQHNLAESFAGNQTLLIYPKK